MKKIIFFLAFALLGATGFGQVKATDVKPKADIACTDLVYEGVDYSNGCFVKLISFCVSPDAETRVEYMLYNSPKALITGQNSGKFVNFTYPYVGLAPEANEDIIRAKLAQILKVKVADVNLK